MLTLLHYGLVLRQLHHKCNNEVPNTMFLIFRKNFPSRLFRVKQRIPYINCLVKNLKCIKLCVWVLSYLQDPVNY
jgi:hypothetical protein